MASLEENFRFIGYYNVNPFLEKLNLLDWNEYTNRQKIRPGMEETFTVPLHWNERFLDITKWSAASLFEKQIIELEEIMEHLFGPGVMKTCVLTKIPAKKSIALHFDCGPFFKKSHRVHIPITTNDNVIFVIDKEEKNLKVGEMWEINNVDYLHGVFNNGDTDRIHLMVDWQFEV